MTRIPLSSLYWVFTLTSSFMASNTSLRNVLAFSLIAAICSSDSSGFSAFLRGAAFTSVSLFSCWRPCSFCSAAAFFPRPRLFFLPRFLFSRFAFFSELSALSSAAWPAAAFFSGSSFFCSFFFSDSSFFCFLTGFSLTGASAFSAFFLAGSAGVAASTAFLTGSFFSFTGASAFLVTSGLTSAVTFFLALIFAGLALKNPRNPLLP